MDSFIRSKYESRRWAREGPPPEDPSTLDTEGDSAPATSPAPQPIPEPPQPRQSLSSASRPAVTTRQPQPHQLLSPSVANRHQQQSVSQVAQPQTTPAPAAQAQAQAQPASSAVGDLFTLDFHPPAPSSAASPTQTAAPQKDIKHDILSLYSTASQTSAVGGFGAGTQSIFGGQQQQAAPVTSMMGNTGVGMWGVSSGWNAAPTAAAAQPNIWGTPAAVPQQQQSLFSNDVWGSAGTTATAAGGGGDLFGSFTSGTPSVQKKDDAFDDIWGGFK